MLFQRSGRRPSCAWSPNSSDPGSRIPACSHKKNGGVPGGGTPPMEDRLRRCGAVAHVAVDYFFVPFVAAGLAHPTRFRAGFAPARGYTPRILCALVSLFANILPL